MGDFEFLQNKINGKWVISAPHRSHRTNVEKSAEICPFCPGNEVEEEELYRFTPDVILSASEGSLPAGRQGMLDSSAKPQNDKSDWAVRVVSNKFPFAPNHEVIVHSPDHHKNWDELPIEQVELVLKTYRERFNEHKKSGSVYIFHNSGFAAGASLGHPHTQLVVVPNNVKLDITPLDQAIYSFSENSDNSVGQSVRGSDHQMARNTESLSAPSVLETKDFLIFCPTTSEWPDEVWIAPKQNGGGFGFIKDSEITDLGRALSRIVQIEDLRHGHEFPYNFYISPNKNWYLRLIPRVKILGGFELGTNIIVNTQDPKETFAFLKEHFHDSDQEKIKKHHQAEYRKRV